MCLVIAKANFLLCTKARSSTGLMQRTLFLELDETDPGWEHYSPLIIRDPEATCYTCQFLAE